MAVKSFTSDFARTAANAVLSSVCSNPQMVVTPDGEIRYARCGSRLVDACPSCSNIAVKDWSAILRSGVFDVDVSSYRWVFVTMTAPTFGATHLVPKRLSERRKCRCGEVHDIERDVNLRGLPVNIEEYDYDGQVAWNRDSGRLWDATRSRLRSLMPNLEYGVVREWQARGALHLHALIRIPLAEALPAAAIAAVCKSVKSHNDDGVVLEWGSQLDARSVLADGNVARQIWYLTKAIAYAVKSVADGGSWTRQGADHWARLDVAARRMRCSSCPRLSTSLCRAVCHRRWGARASVVSVSRPTKTRPGWSLTGLTRTRQRAERCAFAQMAASRSLESVEAEIQMARHARAVKARLTHDEYLAAAARHPIGRSGQPRDQSSAVNSSDDEPG